MRRKKATLAPIYDEFEQNGYLHINVAVPLKWISFFDVRNTLRFVMAAIRRRAENDLTNRFKLGLRGVAREMKGRSNG